MNKAHTLSELFFQLEKKYKNFFELIYRIYKEKLDIKDTYTNEEIIEELSELSESIKVLFTVLKNEIHKMKLIKHKKQELEKLQIQSKKYDEQIKELNKILISALEKLKKDNYIFKMSSTMKNVSHANFQPRDLMNLTLRINKNYSSGEGQWNFLPDKFLTPYPREQVEMKASFLKFNLDEGLRLKAPTVIPEGGVVKKGSIIEIKYPENVKDVFFRYTLSSDLIPSYFSGEFYDSLNPPKIERNLTLKVVACKPGFLDSQVKTLSLGVTGEEEAEEDMIYRTGAQFNQGIMRPGPLLRCDGMGFNKIEVDINDSSPSHFTPGSLYQISLHRRESAYANNDIDDGL